VVANYGIFYFRIIVLGESPSKARRAYQQAYQQRREDYIKRLHSDNIVMANSTLTKYTETYVALHKKYLTDAGFYLHLFYGGHLPTSEKQHGLFLPDDSCSKGLRLMKQCLFHFPDELHYQKTAIKKYLLANNIKLVLGEFGLVSAEMAPICKELNIPLIAIFYGGYDIHNKKVLEQAKDKYQLLFNYASCIIGVSKEITGILKNLGADEQKIFYLPCAVDLDKFAYTDHSVNQPVFLSVGRFAETKSPHLTILAFHEVLKKVPDAQLRMIGKDGGGELFEACHILVKALKIEDKVTFLGIRSTDEVYEEMKKARVFVQHSLTTPITGEKEGTPVAVMEAMACGLPVVATRHAGIAELIEHGQTGMLVDEYDYMAMAEKMAEVCLSDRLVFEIGKNAAISIRSNERIARHKEILIDLVNKYILQ
jgi:glycosyltransferase involved in cell wall biosynthesis